MGQAVRLGYLRMEADALHLTPLGQDEIGKYIVAMRAWLAAELADWGADEGQLANALGDLATRFVEQTPELTSGPAASRSLQRPS